jgi:hypothetical protein
MLLQSAGFFINNLLELSMSIQLNVDVADVNTILEGLGRIQENAAQVANRVRAQASAQFNAQLEAESAAQKAAEDAANQSSTSSMPAA